MDSRFSMIKGCGGFSDKARYTQPDFGLMGRAVPDFGDDPFFGIIHFDTETSQYFIRHFMVSVGAYADLVLSAAGHALFGDGGFYGLGIAFSQHF